MPDDSIDIFQQAEQLSRDHAGGRSSDLARFKPKSAPGQDRPTAAELASLPTDRFVSREVAPPRRRSMLVRTGRNRTFAVKATPATIDQFYAIAERHGLKAAEVFERALAALARELDGEGEGA